MSQEQDDETSENDTMGGRTDPFVLIRVRAKRVIACWHDLTTTTHQRAFGKTARAIHQLENAIEDYESERLGQVVDAMTPEQVHAYLEMMGVNIEELEYRAAELRKKLETKNWGQDQIMNQNINEGGTPT
jgi:hypothetical protein